MNSIKTDWNSMAAATVIFLIAPGMAIINIRSFQNKGFLFNNAFIYASKTERETMDKKPCYRQSGIVFLLLSIIFIVIGLSVLLMDARWNLLEIPLLPAVVIYAVVSSVRIGKRKWFSALSGPQNNKMIDRLYFDSYKIVEKLISIYGRCYHGN